MTDGSDDSVDADHRRLVEALTAGEVVQMLGELARFSARHGSDRVVKGVAPSDAPGLLDDIIVIERWLGGIVAGLLIGKGGDGFQDEP